MKKIFLLVIFVFTTKSFGQTYGFNLKTGVLCNTCWDPDGPPGPTYNTFTANSFSWNVKNNGTTVASNTQSGYVPNGTSFKPYSNVTAPLKSIFSISINSTGQVNYGSSSGPCNTTSNTVTKSLEDLIIDSSMGFSDSPCGINTLITTFTPNVSITNNKTSSICSGEELDLVGSAGFPNVAYHWQYSKDNEVTWIDVPSSIGNNLKTNDTPQTGFSINEIFPGAKFGQQFYFRLGYGQNRQFSNVIPITYFSCAPVVTNLQPVQPNCSGDPMTVIVTFDRPLDKTKNEKLTYFQIIKKTGELTRNQIPEITAFDIANPLQFTYNNVIGLENGEIYNVKYQAFQGTKERGVPPTNKDFPYTDPEKFHFTATPIPALCNGNNGAIEILAWGGSSPFKYQLDNGTKTLFKNPDTIVEGTISKQKIVIEAGSTPNPDPNILTNHSIIVTDNKGCIDKNANQ